MKLCPKAQQMMARHQAREAHLMPTPPSGERQLAAKELGEQHDKRAFALMMNRHFGACKGGCTR